MLEFDDPIIASCARCGSGLMGDEEDRASYREGTCDACHIVDVSKENIELVAQNAKMRRVVQLTRVYLETRAPHIFEVLLEALKEVSGRLPGERDART